MTYDPPTYWIERGLTYEQEATERGWLRSESRPLMRQIGKLRFTSILEVGCGFGRVGAALLRRRPRVAYTGLDVSPELLKGAKQRIPAGEFICADLATFDTDRQWDLVLAAGVLGHLKPEDVGAVIERMRKWARRDIVASDWDAVGERTDYQYGHDFRALYGRGVRTVPMGKQTLFHLRTR